MMNLPVGSRLLWQGDFDGGTTLFLYLTPLEPSVIFWELIDPGLPTPLEGKVSILFINNHAALSAIIESVLESIRALHLDFNLRLKNDLIQAGVRIQ